MRIMIFGDSASGKSTFSIKLGEQLNIEPWHLDVEMDSIGRENRGRIGEIIRYYVDNHEHWVIEGNAFTKDKTYRLENTDIVILFDPARIKTFSRVIRRYMRQKAGKESRVGSQDASLDLGYYVPYIFWHFPKRKRTAANYARSLGKKVIIVKSYSAADNLLRMRFWDHG